MSESKHVGLILAELSFMFPGSIGLSLLLSVHAMVLGMSLAGVVLPFFNLLSKVQVLQCSYNIKSHCELNRLAMNF